VRAAAKIGVPALPFLERALQDGDSCIREEAVRAAGEIGVPALYILEKAMGDVMEIRAEVVRVAGEIGADALPLLERAMRDKDPYVQELAVRIADNLNIA
jgi:HEAT repeat protein